MGPLEIAPGTQWDDGRLWRHEMFPPQEAWPRYVMVTREFHASLPPIVREHLVCRVVDMLVSIAQKHGIEGLVMPGQR